ncbi:MAG: hypothetical protein HQM12_05255 [SAR324 cluster bacterium]|nr:hypothetical protein [SAR324 cluster bacterium]
MKNITDQEKFWEERFGEFNRILLEEQIRQHDLHKPASSFDRKFALKHIHFAEGVPPRVQTILQQLIPSILEFCDQHGLGLKDMNHQIRFLDNRAYEEETGRTLPARVPLPASLLEFNAVSRVYTVMVILPPQIQSTEQIINITRTLFSKFIGDIYLWESVLSHEFYRTPLPEESQLASVPEQLDLIRSIDCDSKIFKAQCQEYARKYQMPWPKQYPLARRQLLEEWKQQWETHTMLPETMSLIETIYREHLTAFQWENPSFLSPVIQEIEKLNAQIQLILPHEIKAYDFFKHEEPFQFVQSIFNKLEQLLALAGFLEEVFVALDDPARKNDLEQLETQLITMLTSMKQEGKGKTFLLPEAFLTEDARRMKQKFPLRLMKLLPKSLPVEHWGKTVKKYHQSYESSIYQKIFEGLFHIKRGIAMIRKGEDFKQSDSFQRLNPLFQNLKYRARELKQWQSTLGILFDHQESRLRKNKTNDFPLELFNKSWGYFVSSILIYLYYQNLYETSPQPQKFNTEKYLNAIEQYVLQQMQKGIKHFYMVYLFLLIYRKKEHEEPMTFLLYIIKQPQATLRYVMSRLSVLEPGDMAQINQQLEKYRDTLIQAYEQRLSEALSAEPS